MHPLTLLPFLITLTLASPLLVPRQVNTSPWSIYGLIIQNGWSPDNPTSITFSWSNATATHACEGFIDYSLNPPSTQGLIPCSQKIGAEAVEWSYDGEALSFNVAWADCALGGYQTEMGSLTLPAPTRTIEDRIKYWPEVSVPIQSMAFGESGTVASKTYLLILIGTRSGFSPSWEEYYCGVGGSA
ncbi:hypothetical protein K490DRAFT_59362 [Saccharata proteae CBS 121410]|uniref:AA1-like domain-containing protein n=1 Tax=Saccharata proteae CBS 121410 TaxID=1314787 RepID=A0A9P4HSY9_9PEZI|nr:hypothetical protein K490DRAFT_59362 [Saccharata proteae CBS 121410]